MINNVLFILTVGLLVTGGLLSFIIHNRPKWSIFLGLTLANLACLSALFLSLNVLVRGVPLSLNIMTKTTFGLDFVFFIDPLSAFFMVVISIVSLSVSIYSYGYVTEYIKKHNVGLLGLLYNLFLLAMFALVASGTSLLFLFFWEVMSLVSFFLVVYDHQDAQVRRAGFIYVVMTHIGTLFIILAYLLLYKEVGSFSFTAAAAGAAKLPSTIRNIIFLFVTLGFGTKAGIIPLHIWLPKAHPAAPSHVSALMSGVMLKTAIYGFVRVVFGILGVGPAWWGMLIVVIGAVSALLGIIYALMEHDIKRLLAYSSVENIGIIFMGIGVSLIFLSYRQNAFALVGLTAGLFHVLNHAIFKGLLFLGAGSVHYSTHTKDMEKMGGLLRRMPWTGFFFLIGSVSISALPLFNGFASEWLTFQSLLLLGSGSLGLVLSLLGPLIGASLALTGGLAGACFIKAFGIQFLALPRSVQAEKAVEVPIYMRIGMGLLAVLSFVIGVLPFLVIRLLNPVTNSLLGVETVPTLGGYRWLNLNLHTVFSAINGPGVSPLALFLVLAFIMGLGYFLVKRVGKGGSVRIDETWNCGMPLTPKMEYTATSFSKPIRIIFRRILQPTREVEKEYLLEPYFTSRIVYKGAIKPFFEDALYRPLTNFFVGFSGKMRFLQSGSIHLYLGYIFVTLVILLIFAR